MIFTLNWEVLYSNKAVKIALQYLPYILHHTAFIGKNGGTKVSEKCCGDLLVFTLSPSRFVLEICKFLQKNWHLTMVYVNFGFEL